MTKRLAIFDFDGTLKDTHDNVPPWYMDDLRLSTDPEEIKRYNQRSLEWLTSIESIEDPEGDDPWIEPIVAAAKEAYADPETWSVLLTARGRGSEPVLRQVLDSKGILFNQYLFKRNAIDPESGATRHLEAPEFKHMELTDLLSMPQMQDVEIVEVYEDSDENLQAMRAAVPEGIEYVPHLETSRREARQTRKAAHKKAAAVRAKERKAFYDRQRAQAESLMEWRTSGMAPLPGDFNRGAPKKRKAPHDATYGSEPDMLDRPGVIVEPDVRKKISDYFTKMKLREFIRDFLKDS